jgi:predicted phage tail protein
MVKKHVDFFSFLIQELKGYFVGAAWLDKMELLVRDNERYAKELKATEKNQKEIFNDRLKSIKEEKEKMLGLNCSVEEGSDQASAEYLQNSKMIKGVFEKEIKDVEATVVEIMSEMKPALDTEAKAKLASLDFDIFSPTIIQEKKVTR